MGRRRFPLLLSLATLLCVADASRAALPPGFTKTEIPGPWSGPVGLAFDAQGRMYVWEREGRVWIVENGAKSAAPLIDLSQEVANYGDHGLLGFALHPNFLRNGWIYLLYAVDPYYLKIAASPNYDPNASEYTGPTIVRLTRYTARSSDGFHSVDPASRRILLGESPDSGCPIAFDSHGAGALAFGSDDSLLASCGDGASYLDVDPGGAVAGSYAVTALAQGILAPREDVGAFRAQLVSSLAGKILRLDPLTGDGLPSNPFFDPNDPRAARSRVFALGFRNPFRFSVRPGTGSHVQADARPGSLYLGNVGWNTWEELEVVSVPGYNSGWPLFEGLDAQPDYAALSVANQDAPNPLYGTAGCTQPFFAFGQLVVQETLGAPSFPNPCNPALQVPASIPRFAQHRPGLAYGRNPDGPWLAPTWSGTTPSSAVVGSPGSPVAGGPTIGGATTVAGVWYTGSDFPAEYRDTFFAGEYGFNHVTNIRYDANDQPTFVLPFDTAAGFVVMVATSPTQGGLYEVDNAESQLWRIGYAATGNQPPVAQASAAPLFGPTPLSVAFSSAGSGDPEGLPLSYAWNFGDGSPPSAVPNPVHTFFGPVGVPTTYTVTLLVQDPSGQGASAQLLVAVNDTPPALSITSPASQGLYAMTQTTNVPLTASIADAEQTPGQLQCAWEVDLHHDADIFPGSVDTNCQTSALLTPIGCDGNDWFYSFTLSVSDGAGLETTRQVALYPDCASVLPAICGNLDASAAIDVSDAIRLRSALLNPVTNGLSPGELSRCSVIGDTACDIADLTVLRRYLAGKAPGPAPVCPAAAP